MPSPCRHLLPLATLAVLLTRAAAAPALQPFWPRFPAPQTVVRLAPCSTRDEEFTAQTVAGLMARRVRDGGAPAYVWLPTAHPAYQRWYRDMLRATGAKEEGPVPLWKLVERCQRSGLVKGYILYAADRSSRPLHTSGTLDPSVNVATSLCAPFQAIAVSEAEEAHARSLGLPRVLDVRHMSEAECFDRYRDRLDRRVLAIQDPKIPNIRAEAVALGSLMLTQPGPLYERALAWAAPDSPILGWGVGDEREQTSPVTRWGHFITATDWCQNLPILANHPELKHPVGRAERPALPSIWELPWERDVHYAAFVMSDGDNVQWLMGDFMEGREASWWSSPDRGSIPMGWTTCTADLDQLCPYTRDRLFSTATPQDDFILFSGGYYYPDEFGNRRPGAQLLPQHAAQIGAYMRQDRVNLLAVNMQHWDSPAARSAYDTYARSIPELQGVFAVQYAPYAAGKGRVIWARDGHGREVPVLSPRFAIWNHSSYSQDGTPGRIAELLNSQRHDGEPSSDQHFSWVIVHAWSWFRRRGPGQPTSAEEIDQARGGDPGTARGLTPVRWCRDALGPHVRVVTPTALVQLLRLHLRPKATLESALQDLEQAARRTPSGAAPRVRQALADARRRLAEGKYAEAFSAGKRAFAVLRSNPIAARRG